MDRNKISEMILEGEEIIYTFKPYYKKVVYRTIISLLIAIVPFILSSVILFSFLIASDNSPTSSINF